MISYYNIVHNILYRVCVFVLRFLDFTANKADSLGDSRPSELLNGWIVCLSVRNSAPSGS